MRIALGVKSQGLDDADPLPPQHDLATGPACAIEGIYRLERPGLLGFIAGRGRRQDAEDIAQRVFTRMLSRGRELDVENPRAYLRKAVVNMLRDGARSQARSAVTEQISIEDACLSDGDPVAALEARDQLARLDAALSLLKPLTREIFVACRVHGYSHAEIAAQTGLSVKGVEKQMGKAIKLLARHLAAHD